MTLHPIRAVPFEDFIDGYFPLALSLRHFLDRRGFASAFIALQVAPMMHIDGLGDEEPVPLHIDVADEGQIDRLAAIARRDGSTSSLSGYADWRWRSASGIEKTDLRKSVRLSEPAFVRGIGFPPGAFEAGGLGAIDVCETDQDTQVFWGRASLASRAQPDGFTWWMPQGSGVKSAWNAPDKRLESISKSQNTFGECIAVLHGGNAVLTRVIKDASRVRLS